jgi:hypothetical protein
MMLAQSAQKLDTDRFIACTSAGFRNHVLRGVEEIGRLHADRSDRSRSASSFGMKRRPPITTYFNLPAAIMS